MRKLSSHVRYDRETQNTLNAYSPIFDINKDPRANTHSELRHKSTLE